VVAAASMVVAAVSTAVAEAMAAVEAMAAAIDSERLWTEGTGTAQIAIFCSVLSPRY
jgi:uncharacterized protein (DUF2147 family)